MEFVNSDGLEARYGEGGSEAAETRQRGPDKVRGQKISVKTSGGIIIYVYTLGELEITSLLYVMMPGDLVRGSMY
jgi:hypothetical protein